MGELLFTVQLVVFLVFRSQAARGKEGIKEGVSEMGTRLDPVPGLPGGKSANTERICVCVHL